MNKRIVILLLAFGMMAHTTGCSSSDTPQDGGEVAAGDQAFTEENGGDFDTAANSGDVASTDAPPADAASGDAPAAGDAVADASTPAAGADDDLKLDDAPSDVASNAAPAAPADGGELSLDGGDNPLPDGVAANPGDQPAPGAEASSAAPAPTDQAPAVAAEPPPTDEPVFNGGGDAPKDGKDTAVAEQPPGADSAAPSGEVASAAPVPDAATDSAPAPAPAFLPLVKVKDAAFNKNGALLNRVYLGRPGDTVKAVATKVYGDESRSKDLASWNPYLKRGVKTGDKIYYQSSKDPSDTKMMTFYEEAGVPAQTYTSKEGDNIRKVSKQLLGSPDSWKEVWATNASVESKGDIPAGLQLRYWPDSDAGTPINHMAKGDVPPPDVGAMPNDPMGAMPGDPGAPPAPPAAMNPPPTGSHPPGQQMAANSPPPPGGMPPPAPGQMNPPSPGSPGPASTPDTGAVGKTAAPPADPLAPPPPPPPDAPAPPPPAPVKKAKAAPVAEPDGGTDQDTMMAVGFGGILLIAAAVLFVVIRKNRAKRMDLGQTQV